MRTKGPYNQVIPVCLPTGEIQKDATRAPSMYHSMYQAQELKKFDVVNRLQLWIGRTLALQTTKMPFDCQDRLVQLEKRNALDMRRLWEEVEPAQPLQLIPLPLRLGRGRFQDVADIGRL